MKLPPVTLALQLISRRLAPLILLRRHNNGKPFLSIAKAGSPEFSVGEWVNGARLQRYRTSNGGSNGTDGVAPIS
jgi:hypothetical protein